jgi:hypothetical protein
MTVVLDKPMLEFKNRIVEGGETLFMIRRLNTACGLDDCGNEKRFVNIDTTTGLKSNFHSHTPFIKR